MRLNLARRPFVNRRPVRRTTALLWFLGAVLLVGNVLLYRQHFAGQGEKRQLQQRVDEATEMEVERIEGLEAELAGLDLERQNEQVEFINRKIAERTFSWSSLFDDLEEVLPADVRLTRLSPGGRRGRGPRQMSVRQLEDGGDRGVFLRITGESQQGASVLAFVESLFAHPSFEDPSLLSESTEDDGTVGFSLTAVYRPPARDATAAAAKQTGPGRRGAARKSRPAEAG